MRQIFLSLIIILTGVSFCFGSDNNSALRGTTDDTSSPRCASTTSPIVKPGIETLRESGFAPLKGKRVGLITNPTGVDNNLESTIDILARADGVTLTALFAPEHGVRGNHVAGANVLNEKDAKTGVTVYSLHGKTRKPTPEMLRNVDVLVYDIQDIGTRSYTFISTMGLAMEAAAENGKTFMVLDRPNPLGGNKIEGCITERESRSFVSRYPIPYIYGLTPGELAKCLIGEKMLSTGSSAPELIVIPMGGWKRSMTFEDTGMPWVLPSPHIPTPQTALLYPSTGIMGELDYVSIGVGYTLPFALTGASWINADKLCERLNELSLDGVEFRPIHYKPFYALFKGENLHGIEIYIRDPEIAELTLIQFYIMQELAALYPNHKAFASATQARLDMFDKVTGSPKIRTLFSRSYRVEDILPYWNKDRENFRTISGKYHLYD